jgi:hypothetical protein
VAIIQTLYYDDAPIFTNGGKMKRYVTDNVGRTYALMLDSGMLRIYDGGVQTDCVFLADNELSLVDKVETYEDAVALATKGTRSEIF